MDSKLTKTVFTQGPGSPYCAQKQARTSTVFGFCMYLKKGYDHVISECPAACTLLGKRCLRNCPRTAREMRFTQIYSVQIWCKKVQTRRKSKAKMVNTAFACKFTWGSKFESKCGIYHLCPLFNLSLHFIAPNLHWVNLAWVLAQNGVVFPPWVPDM